MRRAVRLALILIGIASIALICYLLVSLGPNEKEIWAPIAGLLAVIASIVSSLPALTLLEIQEDASQPRPTPYFDLTSRYSLLQLRVKNIGAGVAYDVRLNWKNRPHNHKGEEITFLDQIPVLLPDQSVSTLVGTSHEFVEKFAGLRFEGVVEFSNVKNERIRQRFICTTQEHGKRLVHDEELPRTLYEIQKIPNQLEKISDALSRKSDAGLRAE